MRVVHFSTSYTGGAAIAAKSLNKALRFRGLNSEIYFLDSQKIDSTNLLLLSRNFREKFMSRIFTFFALKVSKNVLFTVYSSRLSSIFKVIANYDSRTTILHFHNWFNMGNHEQFSKISQMGFAIVFTIHDERFYTGGCHYSFDCLGFTGFCQTCPELLPIFQFAPSDSLRRSKGVMNEMEAIFIAPSQWIAKRAKASQVLKGKKVVHIPNYIQVPDTDSNHLPNAKDVNTQTKIVIGVASMNPFDYIKGGVLISEILKIMQSENFRFLFLSKEKSENIFWREIDYLLVPSIADNSPNVIHEAKLYGIPVIAPRVGGIEELLGVYDVVLPNLIPEEVIKIIRGLNLKIDSDIKNKISDEYYNYRGDPIEKHISLYQMVLRDRA